MKKILMVGALILSVVITTGAAYSTRFGAPAVNGKGNVTAPMLGDIVYDSSDNTFYGWGDDGVSEGWVALSSSPGNVTPPGAIIAYSGTSDPTGYLICDGREVSRTTYAALFAAIGETYGDGDAATTFNLPDLRGRFLRGADNSAGRDIYTRTAMNSGGNTSGVGSIQADEVGGHNHGFKINGNTDANTSINTTTYLAWRPPGSLSLAHATTNATNFNMIANSTGAESRPINAAVNYIIKH